MEKLFEVCNDQAWPTMANIMAEWLCGFNQISLLTESYEKTMRHCCPQMALPWETGARQAVLINITICVFVLKKKSRRLLSYTPGRTELSLEMDVWHIDLWFPSLPAAFSFLHFPLPSSRGHQHPILDLWSPGCMLKQLSTGKNLVIDQ